MKLAKRITENSIDYVLDEATETYLPNLEIAQTEPIGKYGRLRKKYLRENHNSLYQAMLIKKHWTSILRRPTEQQMNILTVL